jgi:hypothetical protein
MKSIVNSRSALAALLLASASLVQAGPLHRSETSNGGLVIMPFWTVDGGQDSLLTVRNDGAGASTVRVRVLDDQGSLIRIISVYLSAGDQWTAAFTAPDGAAELVSVDGSCVLLEDGSGAEAKPGDPLLLNLGAATAGSLEIIEMASVPPDSIVAAGGVWTDCATLAGLFVDGGWANNPNAGLSAPAEGIAATLSILTVEGGSMSTIEGAALSGFSDVPQHEAPTEFDLDLSSAVDQGSGNAKVRSRVCIGADCRIDEWNQPLEAMAAVLTIAGLSAEFSISPVSQGRVDLVLHRPLERYENEIIGTSAPVEMRLRDRAGAVVLPQAADQSVSLERSLVMQVLGFDPTTLILDPPAPIPSPVLSYEALPEFSVQALAETGLRGGVAELRFEDPGQSSVVLISASGFTYVGEPVIAFGVQQFRNGTIDVGGNQPVLSNYRGTIEPRVSRRINAPLF